MTILFCTTFPHSWGHVKKQLVAQFGKTSWDDVRYWLVLATSSVMFATAANSWNKPAADVYQSHKHRYWQTNSCFLLPFPLTLFFGLLSWLFLSLLAVESAGRSVDQQSVGCWVCGSDSWIMASLGCLSLQAVLLSWCLFWRSTGQCKSSSPLQTSNTLCSKRHMLQRKGVLTILQWC